MANKKDLIKKQKEVFGDYDENFGLFGKDNRPFSQRLLESGLPFSRALANYMDPDGDAIETLKLAAEDVLPFYSNIRNNGTPKDYITEAVLLGIPMNGAKTPVKLKNGRTILVNDKVPTKDVAKQEAFDEVAKKQRDWGQMSDGGYDYADMDEGAHNFMPSVGEYGGNSYMNAGADVYENFANKDKIHTRKDANDEMRAYAYDSYNEGIWDRDQYNDYLKENLWPREKGEAKAVKDYKNYVDNMKKDEIIVEPERLDDTRKNFDDNEKFHFYQNAAETAKKSLAKKYGISPRLKDFDFYVKTKMFPKEYKYKDAKKWNEDEFNNIENKLGSNIQAFDNDAKEAGKQFLKNNKLQTFDELHPTRTAVDLANDFEGFPTYEIKDWAAPNYEETTWNNLANDKGKIIPNEWLDETVWEEVRNPQQKWLQEPNTRHKEQFFTQRAKLLDKWMANKLENEKIPYSVSFDDYDAIIRNKDFLDNSDALKQHIFDRTKDANMTYLYNDKNLPSNTRQMLMGEYEKYTNKVMNDPNMTMDEKLQAMGKFDQEMKKMIDLQSDF